MSIREGAPSPAPGGEESEQIDDSCVICGNDESESFDLIIFCDGCDITVCQTCYSVPKVPDGDWFCRPCAAGARDRMRGKDVTCVICKQGGGALEPTMCGRWAHTACCQALEEVFFVSLGKGGTAADLSKMFPERRNYNCTYCEVQGGTCVVCPRGNCRTAFHPMCARSRADEDGLVLYVEELTNGQPVTRICCAEHSKKLGGKPPTDVRKPADTRALPSPGRCGTAAGKGAGAIFDASDSGGGGHSVCRPGPLTSGPRQFLDPVPESSSKACHRRKRARRLAVPAFVDDGLRRPADTFVLFDRVSFDRFAKRTAHLRKLQRGQPGTDQGQGAVDVDGS